MIHFNKVKLFSRKTILEVCAAITVNITSGWFGIIFILPGSSGISDIKQYLPILFPNLLFGIVGLVISFWLTEKAKKLKK